MYNGQNLPIVGCNANATSDTQKPLMAQNNLDGTMEEVDGYCDLQTFIDSLGKVLYIGDEPHLKELCFEQPPIPTKGSASLLFSKNSGTFEVQNLEEKGREVLGGGEE